MQPSSSLPALRRVAEQLRLNNGEGMDAKVSVLSHDSLCKSLDDELRSTFSQLSDGPRPSLQDLMRSIHPSEVDWCPDEVQRDSTSFHPVATDLWTLLIDDKARCSCREDEPQPNHLQQPLLGLCPCEDESGNITFDLLFNTACPSAVSETTFSCRHESSVTIKRYVTSMRHKTLSVYRPSDWSSGPMKGTVSKPLKTGDLCGELSKTHGKRLPLSIHIDTESNHPASMTVGLAEDMIRFPHIQAPFSLGDDGRVENMDPFGRIRLAADLSSSFYHFYGTQWMSRPWLCEQIWKFETPEASAGDKCDQTSLVLSYYYEDDPNPNDWELAPAEYRKVLGRCWPQLLGFGLILLELMCDSNTRRRSREIPSKDNLWKRYCAARELRMRVEKDLHPFVNECLESIFENRLFQDAVDDQGLERRRYIIREKVTAQINKLLHMCTIKTQQHKNPISSTNSDGAPMTNFRFRTFIQTILKPRSRR